MIYNLPLFLWFILKVAMTERIKMGPMPLFFLVFWDPGSSIHSLCRVMTSLDLILLVLKVLEFFLFEVFI